jgi:ATP-dependent Lon protease
MKTKKSDKALIIPTFKTDLFPGMETKVRVDKTLGASIKQESSNGILDVIAMSIRDGADKKNLHKKDFYSTGTLLKTEIIEETEKGLLLSIQAHDIVSVTSVTLEDKIFIAEYSVHEVSIDMSKKEEAALLDRIKETVTEIGKNFQGSETYLQYIESLNKLDDIIIAILPYMNATISEMQEILQGQFLKEKYLAFIELLMKQKERVDFQVEIADKVTKKNSKQYREAMLKEQLKAIQDELNEGNDSISKIEDYRNRIETSPMPVDVKKVAVTEVNKLESMGQNNSESHVVRNYLDLLLALPWKTEKVEEIKMNDAREILNSDHYGLDKVKDRIIQHMAVMKLKEEKQGSILLLVGPPGTGKTSLGKSIARALGRKYVRASLGGVRDEAEIRGHRRTYVGALPGRIINGIKKAESNNPVFVLDEIDKLMTSYSGDPASALLEVLDPEQNNSFSDHYLEVPYDLSDVFFIATANSLSSIPAPLLDRMEIIDISSYTNKEKFRIGKDHLVPEIFEDHGISDKMLIINDEAMESVIDNYTREAGVRGLKKQITSIVRYASEKVVAGDVELPIKVDAKALQEILGREVAHHEDLRKDTIPGIATGLAWTPVGGEILFIESIFMKGTGQLSLTGQLGDVMKESAKISLSLIRSRLSHLIRDFNFAENDIHIHVPSGATPKDGPSAGVTLFTALVSLIAGKKIKSKLAMTGEITLSGNVLPVGGIKEKVLAAYRSGVRQIIIPLENEKDIEDIPEDVRNVMTFSPVETVEEVVKIALDIELPKQKFHFMDSGFEVHDSATM